MKIKKNFSVSKINRAIWLSFGFLILSSLPILPVKADSGVDLGVDTNVFEQIFKDSKNNQGVVVSQVGFNNARIINQENNKIEIFFEMENPGKPEGNLLYGLQLEKKIDQENYNLVDEKYFPERISLGTGETISRKIDYVAPDFYSGEYRLWLIGKNNSGSPRGITFLGEIKLEGGNSQYIDVSNCYLQIENEEKKYTLWEGVSYKVDEAVNLTCDFTSYFDTPVTANLAYQLFRRSISSGEKVDLASDSKETLYFREKGEKTTASFSLPTIKKPQAYDLVLQLKDQANKIISSQIKVHLVLSGETVTINSLKLDKENYQKGEQAQVNLEWTGPADNFPDSRQITQNSNLKVFLEVDLSNWEGRQCAQHFQYPFSVDRDYDSEIFNILIERDCEAVQGIFLLKNEKGEILDQWKLNFNPKPKMENVSSDGGWLKEKKLLILFGTLLLLVILILIFVIVWRKRKSSSINKLMSVLLIFVGMIIFTNQTKAATSATLQIVARAYYGYSCADSTGYKCTGGVGCSQRTTTEVNCAQGGDLYCSDSNNLCYNNAVPGLSAQASVSINKSSYQPGETITVSASGFLTSPCGNTVYSKGYACIGTDCNIASTREIFSKSASNRGTTNVSNERLFFLAPSAPGDYDMYVRLDYLHNPFYSIADGVLSFSVVANSVNGICGSANGTTVSTAPTTNLCNAGTPSAVSGTGPWTWTCSGSNGGTDASCTATYSSSCPTVTIDSLTANPSTINQGYTSTISWSTSNATTCKILKQGETNPVYDYNGGSGSTTVSPTVTSTFDLTCWSSCSGSESSPAVTRSVTVTVNTNPIGSFDYAGCDTLTGWAFDQNNTGVSIDIDLYRDGPYGAGGTFIGRYSANIYRSDVNSTYNITGNHGFSIATPPSLKDGNSHRLYVYAIDSNGGNNVLTIGSPKTISCQSAINGVCGSAGRNYLFSETSFSGDFCSAGTPSPSNPSFPAPGSSTTWTCLGQNGGTNDYCTATHASPIPGSCGLADGKVTCSKPDKNLCGVGKSSNVTLSGSYWIWTCYSPDGFGSNKDCSARKECPWSEVGN